MSVLDAAADPGSYRDPGGRVHVAGDRIFRTVMPVAAAAFEATEASGTLGPLVADGLLVPWTRVATDGLGPWADGASAVLEHPRLPFVSYPWEWPFAALRSAALLHLDVQLRALDGGITLSDATAFNVQFDGVRPVFIDRLSFRPYRPGEVWSGHRQFGEQFLNPLLLRALLGVPFNAWFRGSLEGIPAEQLSRLLPLRRKLSWRVLTNVVALAALQRAAGKPQSLPRAEGFTLPEASFRRILGGLRRWIASLQPQGVSRTVWRNYATDNSYSSEQAAAKRSFVVAFAGAVKPALLWDVGCNTGDYSKAALEGGARRVIGFDVDPGAVELAWSRAEAEGLAFTPLLQDLVNPSPSQGWAEAERGGLNRRRNADAVIALAVIHHLAIGRNIPLEQAVDALVGLAPDGIIEFVPKADPMVQEMLWFRGDIFPDYTPAAFERALRSRARIVHSEAIPGSHRTLYRFTRR